MKSTFDIIVCINLHYICAVRVVYVLHVLRDAASLWQKEFHMFSKYNLEEIRNHARAAFIGMAIGDALGATVEFMTASEIAAKYGTFREIIGGGWLRLKPGQVTDDTEMALCIARAIVN